MKQPNRPDVAPPSISLPIRLCRQLNQHKYSGQSMFQKLLQHLVHLLDDMFQNLKTKMPNHSILLTI